MNEFSITDNGDGTKTIADNVKGVTQRLDRLHRVQLPLTCMHPVEYHRVHTIGSMFTSGGELYDTTEQMVVCILCGAVLDDEEINNRKEE